VHNFAGPLFAVSLVIVIVTFVRDNLPRAGDLNWLLKGGGMFGGMRWPRTASTPARSCLLGWRLRARPDRRGVGPGARQAGAGLGETRGADAGGPHDPCRAAVLMLALFIGHIYMGTSA
jgi:formate dehydrogenase subunit gamma